MSIIPLSPSSLVALHTTRVRFALYQCIYEADAGAAQRKTVLRDIDLLPEFLTGQCSQRRRDK